MHDVPPTGARSRLGKIGMGATFSAFVLLGGFLVVVGDAEGRVIGLICVLFFGFGGLAYFGAHHRRGRRALHIDTLVHEGVPTRALVAPTRTSKQTMLALGGLGMGSGSLLMAIYAPLMAEPAESTLFIRAVAGFGAVFFGGIGFLGLLALVRGARSVLAFTEHGLVMTGLGESFVPWEAITDLATYEQHVYGSVQRFAALKVSDPSLLSRSRGLGLLVSANRAVSGWDLTYPEGSFDLDAEELTMLISAFVQFPDLRRLVGTLPDAEFSYGEFEERHLRTVAS